MTISIEELKSLSKSALKVLYKDAKGRFYEGGREEMVFILENTDSETRLGGQSANDPVYKIIHKTVNSEKGKTAAISATNSGLPALAGVDALLQNELGIIYTKRDTGTAVAGDVVKILMELLGYTAIRSGDCPPGCVTKTGWIFKKT